MKSPYAAEDRVSPARRDPISQLLLTQTDSNVNLLGIRAWGKVFISYARGDEGFVRRLCADLASHQVEYWLDSKDIRA